MTCLTHEQEAWCDAHCEEAVALLKTLAAIPAPSGEEDRRCAFLLDRWHALGGKDAFTDSAKNVILPIGVTETNALGVIAAHTDIVFPDTEPIPVREEGGMLRAPGIGDDTANLVNLMMASQYLLEHGVKPRHGLLIAADSCEEGLGNLKGIRRITEEYGARMRSFVSLDLHTGRVSERAVGSRRYRVRIKAQGGHSYTDFGNTNAIEQASRVIAALYAKKAPERARTTYNIGVIRGGTTVNSICAECELLYEYRSEDRGCLAEMERFFQETIGFFRADGMRIETERIGDRPCGGDVDPTAQETLGAAMAEITRECTGRDVTRGAALSTDCNATLAAGIPSACVGTVVGGGSHTREEWIDPKSLREGMKIALAAALYLAEA